MDNSKRTIGEITRKPDTIHELWPCLQILRGRAVAVRLGDFDTHPLQRDVDNRHVEELVARFLPDEADSPSAWAGYDVENWIVGILAHGDPLAITRAGEVHPLKAVVELPDDTTCTLASALILEFLLTRIYTIAQARDHDPAASHAEWTNVIQKYLNDAVAEQKEIRHVICGLVRHWTYSKDIVHALITRAGGSSYGESSAVMRSPLGQLARLSVLKTWATLKGRAHLSPCQFWVASDALVLVRQLRNPHWYSEAMIGNLWEPTHFQNVSSHLIGKFGAKDIDDHVVVDAVLASRSDVIFPSKVNHILHPHQLVVANEVSTQVIHPLHAFNLEPVGSEVSTVVVVFAWLTWLKHGQKQFNSIRSRAENNKSPRRGLPFSDPEDSFIIFGLHHFSTAAKASAKTHSTQVLFKELQNATCQKQWQQPLDRLMDGLAEFHPTKRALRKRSSLFLDPLSPDDLFPLFRSTLRVVNESEFVVGQLQILGLEQGIPPGIAEAIVKDDNANLKNMLSALSSWLYADPALWTCTSPNEAPSNAHSARNGGGMMGTTKNERPCRKASQQALSHIQTQVASEAHAVRPAGAETYTSDNQTKLKVRESFALRKEVREVQMSLQESNVAANMSQTSSDKTSLAASGDLFAAIEGINHAQQRVVSCSFVAKRNPRREGLEFRPEEHQKSQQPVETFSMQNSEHRAAAVSQVPTTLMKRVSTPFFLFKQKQNTDVSQTCKRLTSPNYSSKNTVVPTHTGEVIERDWLPDAKDIWLGSPTQTQPLSLSSERGKVTASSSQLETVIEVPSTTDRRERSRSSRAGLMFDLMHAAGDEATMTADRLSALVYDLYHDSPERCNEAWEQQVSLENSRKRKRVDSDSGA
ncbi:hypothetical protein V5O48_009172 [Marasmius crinis-equi]|uniref:Uncharacterized protein n=1 Tax=Marasmius crinis-equi TaxID=585013 RepID=A0ABR3FBU4_9AGAR